MLNISNVSLRAFNVALRWASRKGFSNNIKDWTVEDSDKIQAVAEEYDRRLEERYNAKASGLIVSSKYIED